MYQVCYLYSNVDVKLILIELQTKEILTQGRI